MAGWGVKHAPTVKVPIYGESVPIYCLVWLENNSWLSCMSLDFIWQCTPTFFVANCCPTEIYYIMIKCILKIHLNTIIQKRDSAACVKNELPICHLIPGLNLHIVTLAPSGDLHLKSACKIYHCVVPRVGPYLPDTLCVIRVLCRPRITGWWYCTRLKHKLLCFVLYFIHLTLPCSNPPQPLVCSTAVKLNPALLFCWSDTNSIRTMWDIDIRFGGRVRLQPDQRMGESGNGPFLMVTLSASHALSSAKEFALT